MRSFLKDKCLRAAEGRDEVLLSPCFGRGVMVSLLVLGGGDGLSLLVLGGG